MGRNRGPMGLACQEIRDAIDAFAGQQRVGRRLPALLARTDAMLTELEMLNLLSEARAPASWWSELTSLVADLPFEYEPRTGHHPSPTAAIDLVFDIQGGLFRLMAGVEPDDELLEVESLNREVSSCVTG
jgi:hypothetical protein